MVMVKSGLSDKGGPKVLIAASVAVILLLAAPVWAQEEAPKPLQGWGGQHCSEKRPGLMVIRNQGQITRLLGERFANSQALDFQKYAIVAVFMGLKMTGGYGVEFKEPYVQEGKLIVPFKERAPGPGSFVTQALTTPCRAQVVPVKPGQEVILKNLLEVSELTYRPVRLQKDHFQCEIPYGWYLERYEKFLEKDGGGMMLMAPPETEGEGVKFFITYYDQEDGNLLKNPEAYVEKYPHAEISKYHIKEKFRTQPPASGLPGRWYGRESTITTRHPFIRKMTVKEQLAVLPARKGFYALHYWAPGELADKYAPVFLRVVKSFRAVD